MEKQEFIDAITQIGTCEDETQRREMLAQLSESAQKDYDTLSTLTASNEQLTKDNETLRDANMKLFLRVGSPKSEEERKKDETGIDNPPPTKREFADLFNEKGEIK
jgi:regulator of replication initiation timing